MKRVVRSTSLTSTDSTEGHKNSLPLTLRAPAPPAWFLGRARENARLGAMLDKLTVVVVQGEPGIGKTALVAELVARRAGTAVAARGSQSSLDPTRWISFADHDGSEPPLLVIARALLSELRRSGARRSALDEIEWRELLESKDALLNLVLEWAEERSLTVVLDDFERIAREPATALAKKLMDHAQDSRWVLVTRSIDDDPALVGHLMSIGAMSPSELRKLARALGADASRVDELVHLAAGSPSRLRKAMTAKRSVSSGHSLTPRALALASVLGELGVPAPASALAAIHEDAQASLSLLESAGAIERIDGQVRLTPSARELPSARASDEEAVALAEKLLETEDSSIAHAALGVLLARRAHVQAARALTRWSSALLQDGFAITLRAALERSMDHSLASPLRATFDRARLAAALALEDRDALFSTSPPDTEDPEARLLWARVLMARDDLGGAAALCDALTESGDGALSEATTFGVGELGARMLLNAGDIAAGIDVLEKLAPPDERASLRRDLMLAAAHANLGRDLPALTLSRQARLRLDAFDGSERLAMLSGLAQCLYQLGRLDEAASLIDAHLARAPSPSSRMVQGRRVHLLRLAIAADVGDVPRGHDELLALGPWVAEGSMLAPYVDTMRAQLALAEGDTVTLASLLATLDRAGRATPIVDALDALRADWTRLQRLAPSVHRSPRDSDEQHVLSAFADVVTHAALVRAGAVEGRLPAAQMEAARARHDEVGIVAHLSDAWSASLCEPPNLTNARVSAQRAADLAASTGHRLRHIEAQSALADVACIEGDRATLARCSEACAQAALGLGSPRAEAMARFLRAVLDDDPASLDWLTADARALDVSIRARMLLASGDPDAGDALDRRVVAALRERGWVRSAPTVCASAAPSWGIDEPRNSVWLQDGRVVSLEDRPVGLSLLCALARAGGRASKEQLVGAVWHERSYHPLRHDNRLHAAVRKLRLLLGDDSHRPHLVGTTPEGYVLLGTLRMRSSSID